MRQHRRDEFAKTSAKQLGAFRKGLTSASKDALRNALDGEETTQRSVQEQAMLDEVMERAGRDGNAPKVVTVASVKDITTKSGPSNALPAGVDAAYIPSKNIILVREGLHGADLKAALSEARTRQLLGSGQ